MGHPQVVRWYMGKQWHLEDQNLRRDDALALRRHLSRTEEKAARIEKTPKGHQVWWAKK